METETIRHFDDMTAHLRRKGYRQRVAVVCGHDASTQQAVARAVAEGFATATFVGKREETEKGMPAGELAGHIKYIEADTPEEAAREAVALVRNGKADILMKGLIGTDTLLRAVLNKETGILPSGRVLTHIAAAQMPSHDGLVFFSDAAVIPYPTHEQRCAQVGYMVRLCHAFGIRQPRIALNHCSEKASEKFPHTTGYAEISRRAREGEWGEAIVDGPLDVLSAFTPAVCQLKGIRSTIEGKADALIFPDIEAGNAFYKTITCFAQACIAGMLQGAACPVVLPSRGDSSESKYYSLALASVSNG